MLYLVTYDLLKPGQNYDRLLTSLKNAGGTKILLSAWLLPSKLTSEPLYNQLLPFLDTNDRILVTEVVQNARWSTLLESTPAVVALYKAHARA